MPMIEVFMIHATNIAKQWGVVKLKIYSILNREKLNSIYLGLMIYNLN